MTTTDDESEGRTLVYTAGGGRLGNQLLNYLNVGAFALEHPGVDVVDLPFRAFHGEYGTDRLGLTSFGSTQVPRSVRTVANGLWGSVAESWGSRYPLNWLRAELLHRIAHHRGDTQSIVGGSPHLPHSLTGRHYDRVDLTEEWFCEQFQSVPTSVVAGWGVRAWPLVEKHRERLRENVLPADRYTSTARSHLSRLRETHQTVVGVLLRQDDYRSWRDGEFFFSSEQYRDWIDRYETDHPSDDIAFLLASDEQQSGSLFDAENHYFATGEAVGDGHYLENFVELSLCDVVVTPPSTFSACAAFLGDVPLVPLHETVEQEGWNAVEQPLLGSRDHPIMKTSVK